MVKLLTSHRDKICGDIGKLHFRLDEEIKSNQEVKTKLEGHFEHHIALDVSTDEAIEKSKNVKKDLRAHLKNHKTYRNIMGTVGTAVSSCFAWIISELPDGFFIRLWTRFR